MILKNVPVIPADLRPMVQLDGGRFATSDLMIYIEELSIEITDLKIIRNKSTWIVVKTKKECFKKQ